MFALDCLSKICICICYSQNLLAETTMCWQLNWHRTDVGRMIGLFIATCSQTHEPTLAADNDDRHRWPTLFSRVFPPSHLTSSILGKTQVTQPHVTQSHWIGSEITERRSFLSVEERSLSRTLAFHCGHGYAEEEYDIKTDRFWGQYEAEWWQLPHIYSVNLRQSESCDLLICCCRRRHLSTARCTFCNVV